VAKLLSRDPYTLSLKQQW